MEADRMKAFAAEFDPQPFHLDEAAAEHTILRGLAASGWHTAAATMRLLMTGGLPIAGGLIGLSAEMAWPNPTRPGDTLRVESEILVIVPSRSKPDRAVVTVRCVTFNQKGDKVAEADSWCFRTDRDQAREQLDRVCHSAGSRGPLRRSVAHEPPPSSSCCRPRAAAALRHGW